MSFDGLAIGWVWGKVGSIIQVELLFYGDFFGYIEVSDNSCIYYWDGVGVVEFGDDVLFQFVFDDNGNYICIDFYFVVYFIWLICLDFKEV